MLPLLIGLGAGALLGGGKAIADRKRFSRENEAFAEAQKWNPWTHLATNRAAPERPSAFNPILQGALMGGLFGNQFPLEGEAVALNKPRGWDMDSLSLEKYLRGG